MSLKTTKPYLIDTHCHLNFQSFEKDWQEVIKRNLEENVWMILVGSEFYTSQRAVEMAQNYENGIYAAIGYHPIHIQELHSEERYNFKEDIYLELAKNKKVVAIGETGFDYYRQGRETEGKQREIFLKQIELAQTVQKPLIFHLRNAGEDLILELQKINSPGLKGVVHCFSQNWEIAKKYLELGLMISFTGTVTFSDEYNEVIQNTPLEKIMIETDAPYLSPEPHRGQRNEPRYVKHIAQRIADVRGISFEEVAKATTENAKKFFNLD